MTKRQRNHDGITTISSRIGNDFVKKQLITTYDEGTGAYGNIFDTVAHRSLNITGIDIHTDVNGTVLVYTRQGSYKNFSNSSQGWILLINSTIYGAGRGKPTKIEFSSSNSVPLQANSTQAFYVTMTTPDIRYTPTEFHNGYPYVNSADLDILVGDGLTNYTFCDCLTPKRLWNGALHYSIGQPITQDYIATNFEQEDEVTSFGSLFYIKSWTNLTMTSIDLHLDSTEKEEIQILARNTSSEAFEWVILYHDFLQAKGKREITSIPYHSLAPLNLLPGDSVPVMIKMKNKILLSSTSTPYDENGLMNDDVKLAMATTLDEDFKQVNNSTYLHTILRYSTTDPPIINELYKVHVASDLDGTSAHTGVLFEIYAENNINIQSFQLSITKPTTNYSVWTRLGASFTEKTNVNNWELVTKGSVMDANDNILMTNPFSVPVSIQYNQTQSFHVQLDDAKIRCFKGRNGNSVFARTSNLKVVEGRSVDNEGDVGENNLNFEGSIYYYADIIHKSQAPSVLPSQFVRVTDTPSSYPSLIPSNIPSINPSDFPSTFPTIANSTHPTFSPTFLNSTLPTIQPSLLPSLVKSSSPSGTPSSSPTTYPSVSPSSSNIISINYAFSILHDSSENKDKTIVSLNSQIISSLSSLLSSDTVENKDVIETGEINLLSVNSRFSTLNRESSCAPEGEFTCSITETEVTTSSNNEITSEMVRYIILSFAVDVTESLPFKYKEYVGIRSLLTSPIVSLDGVDSFDGDSSTFFEQTMKDFLNEVIENDSVIVTSVTASTKESVSRRLNSGTSLDVSTFVLGEYQPPPEISFDAVVEESIEDHNDVFIEKMKESPKFTEVREISAVFPSTSPPSSAPRTTEENLSELEPSFVEKNFLILVISVSLFIVITCALLIYAFFSKQSKEAKKMRSIEYERSTAPCNIDQIYNNHVNGHHQPYHFSSTTTTSASSSYYRGNY